MSMPQGYFEYWCIFMVASIEIGTENSNMVFIKGSVKYDMKKSTYFPLD